MHPVIDGLLAVVLRCFGIVIVALCLVGLCLVLLLEFKSPESAASIQDSVNNIRSTSLVWIGMGCLMIIGADVLEGKFRWRK